jgi:hypothetical protein
MLGIKSQDETPALTGTVWRFGSLSRSRFPDSQKAAWGICCSVNGNQEP